jgi:hypothetical protein
LIYRYILIPNTRKRFLQKDQVILDQALWRHAQDPAANAAFQQKMRDLESDLKGPEKDQLGKYLTTFR